MANSIQYDYRILDRYSAPLAKIAKATRRMKDVAAKTSKSIKGMGKSFKDAAGKMSNLQGALAGAGITAGITSIVESTTKIQDAISDVGKVSDMTAPQLEGLRKNLEGLSERIGRPAESLARIAFEGKKLGTSDKDLQPFVETVAKMAVAFDMTEEAAGASIGSIKSKLGLSMDAVISFGDSINHLANTTASGGENMIDIIARTSGTMKMLKVPPEIIAGFASIGDQLSTSSELGASGLNMMFSRMALMPGMTTKLMSDPVKAVQDVMGKFAKMPEANRIQAIYKVFGQEAGKFVLKLVPSMELFGETMKKAMSTDAIGSMQKEMNSYLGRASTNLKRAKEKMVNAINRFGEALVPIIVIIANVSGTIGIMIGKFSEAHPKLAKLTAGLLVLTAGITGVMVVAGILIPLFAALSWPVIAIIAGVIALAAAFAYWVKTSNPLIQRMSHVWSLISEIVNLFGEMFGVTDLAGGSLSLLGGVFDMLGTAISWAIKPLLIFLEGLKMAISVATKLFDMDFAGAFMELKKGVINMGKIVIGTDVETDPKIKKSMSHMAAGRGMGFGVALAEFRRNNDGVSSGINSAASDASKTSMAPKAQKIEVGGDIVVSAKQGSKVESVAPRANTGTNMRME